MALWSPSKKLKFAIRSFYKVLAIQERREKPLSSEKYLEDYGSPVKQQLLSGQLP